MPVPTCPWCKSENVKQIVVWRNGSANLKIKDLPQTMWACKKCLYKWPRALPEISEERTGGQKEL
jgi:transposase-like protein